MMSWAMLFGGMVASGHAKLSLEEKLLPQRNRVIAKVTSTDMSMEIHKDGTGGGV